MTGSPCDFCSKKIKKRRQSVRQTISTLEEKVPATVVITNETIVKGPFGDPRNTQRPELASTIQFDLKILTDERDQLRKRVDNESQEVASFVMLYGGDYNRKRLEKIEKRIAELISLQNELKTTEGQCSQPTSSTTESATELKGSKLIGRKPASNETGQAEIQHIEKPANLLIRKSKIENIDSKEEISQPQRQCGKIIGSQRKIDQPSGWDAKENKELSTGFKHVAYLNAAGQSAMKFGNSQSMHHESATMPVPISGTPKQNDGKKYCIFCCRTNHSPEDCRAYRTLRARKRQLFGRCYACLQATHKISNCHSSICCIYCNAENNHHSSLCVAKFGKANSTSTEKPSKLASRPRNMAQLSDLLQNSAKANFDAPSEGLKIHYETTATQMTESASQTDQFFQENLLMDNDQFFDALNRFPEETVPTKQKRLKAIQSIRLDKQVTIENPAMETHFNFWFFLALILALGGAIVSQNQKESFRLGEPSMEKFCANLDGTAFLCSIEQPLIFLKLEMLSHISRNNSFLAWLAEIELAQNNAARKLDHPTEKETRRSKLLSDQELVKFIETSAKGTVPPAPDSASTMSLATIKHIQAHQNLELSVIYLYQN